jgi:hypothetical protein
MRRYITLGFSAQRARRLSSPGQRPGERNNQHNFPAQRANRFPSKSEKDRTIRLEKINHPQSKVKSTTFSSALTAAAFFANCLHAIH